MLRADGLHAGIRETDRVDHPATELRHARRGSPRARLRAHRFRDEPTQRPEIDHAFQLVPVGGRAGGEDDGILESETCRLNLESGAAARHCRDTPPVEAGAPVATRRS